MFLVVFVFLSLVLLERISNLTLLHFCTFLSFVTELLCALDHAYNAFALAQVAWKNRLPFDMVAER